MDHTVAAVPREVAWWLSLASRALRRFPGLALVSASVAWLTAILWPLWVPFATAALCIGLRCWAICLPDSFQGFLAGPVQRVWWRIKLRSTWSAVAEACGLATFRTSGDGSVVEVPKLLRVSASGPRVRLRIRPLPGQIFEDFEKAATALRTAVAADRVRVDPDGPREVVVTFTLADLLGAPFEARPPSDRDTSRVWMGRVEDGSDWWLPVGPHTLVAGCSGAGKGSVFWSYIFGLAPAVRAGTVRLHGIDLKGGMEILMGADLFTTRATNAAEAVSVLETLVDQLRERTCKYAGRVRTHTPTVDEPLQVVMIDELAVLTAYCPERDLQRRAEMAINLLCSQGRAPGFVVFACLQDPRKEVIPARGLFTQMIGLRLKDVSETAMVLGEAALMSGAHCHRILPSTPGIGYVVPENGSYPVRVRSGYASDDSIRKVAGEFATPVQMPVTEATRPDFDELRRVRRSTRGSAVS